MKMYVYTWLGARVPGERRRVLVLDQERMCADRALNLCHLGWYD